jgi:ribosomal protein S18 acetylase RimI-like enzyme
VESVFTSGIVVRTYREKDYAFIHDLSRDNMEHFVRLHWGGWNEKFLRKDMKPAGIRIVSCSNRDIAFFEVVLMRKTLHLRNIQVARECQRKGIGSLLMDLVEEEARKAGAKTIKLTVFADNPALDFYEHRGFVVTIRDDGTVGMVKKLRKA